MPTLAELKKELSPELLEELAQKLGFGNAFDIEFIAAIESGEITGDLIAESPNKSVKERIISAFNDRLKK